MLINGSSIVSEFSRGWENKKKKKKNKQENISERGNFNDKDNQNITEERERTKWKSRKLVRLFDFTSVQPASQPIPATVSSARSTVTELSTGGWQGSTLSAHIRNLIMECDVTQAKNSNPAPLRARPLTARGCVCGRGILPVKYTIPRM